MGEAWLPSADRSRLECHPVWHGVAPGLAEFRQVSRQLGFAPGEGLPGRVWQTKQAEWIADLGPRSRFPRLEVARRAGLAAGLGVPVLAHGEVVLVLDFFLFEPTDEDVQQMRLIAAVAAQIGSLIGRKQAEAARAASESHFRRLIENASDLVTLVDGARRGPLSGSVERAPARLHPRRDDDQLRPSNGFIPTTCRGSQPPSIAR